MKAILVGLSKGRVLLWSLVAIVLVSSSALAQPQEMRSRPSVPSLPSGNSTVKGRVVYKDNQQPLANVQLRVFNSEGASLMIVANAQGEFVIPNLGAGQYYVSIQGPRVAMQSGFGVKVPIPLGAIPRREDFEPIVPKHDGVFTVNGTDSIEADIMVPRGGTISGKIMKTNGAALPFAQVDVMSREGSGRYTARFSTQSDKDGLYKITRVPEGDYIVAVSVENKNSSADIRAHLRGETRVFSFHPATTNAKDAASIHVDTGRETSGVNITLVEPTVLSVSGIVVRGKNGTPLVGATVLLRNKEADFTGPLLPGMNQRTTRTDSEGHWMFNNVAQGEYVVTALAPRDRHERPGDAPIDREREFRESRTRFLVAQQDVILANIGVEGIVLPIYGPGTLVGTVQTDDGSAVPENFVIFLEHVSKTSRPAPPMPVRVRLDGSFMVGEIPSGDVFVSIGLPSESRYFVKSITASGSDVTRSPLRIIEGAEAGPLQVTISQAKAAVAGLVRRQNPNDSLTDVVVVFVPTDPDKQRFRTSYLTARPNEKGTFEVSGPPGEYYAFARRRDELPPIVTADFVRSQAGNVERLSLNFGQMNQIELRLP